MYLVVGREDCPYCDKAKETLDYWQESYVYASVEDKHWLDLFVGMGLKTVPQVFKLVGGYTELLEEGINDVR